MSAVTHTPDPAWRQTEREIDQSDYDWQQDQLRIDRCPVCGGADYSDSDGECRACGWMAEVAS